LCLGIIQRAQRTRIRDVTSMCGAPRAIRDSSTVVIDRYIGEGGRGPENIGREYSEAQNRTQRSIGRQRDPEGRAREAGGESQNSGVKRICHENTTERRIPEAEKP